MAKRPLSLRIIIATAAAVVLMTLPLFFWDLTPSPIQLRPWETNGPVEVRLSASGSPPRLCLDLAVDLRLPERTAWTGFVQLHHKTSREALINIAFIKIVEAGGGLQQVKAVCHPTTLPKTLSAWDGLTAILAFENGNHRVLTYRGRIATRGTQTCIVDLTPEINPTP